MLIFKLLLLSMVSLATTDLRVLFFTMDACPPCRQTEPGIDQLRVEGIAVSKIDARQYSDYARQCQVSQTPTIMVVQGNEVLARHTGPMSYDELRGMLAHSQQLADRAATPPSRDPALAQGNTRAAVSTQLANREATSNLTPEQRALQATVRFRVEDDQGASFATGTIIHRQGDEALVLTCGHVFRDSQGQGTIKSDLGFAFGPPRTVVGKLIYYDAQAHDIALVAIPCPLPIEPVAVAPESMAVQTGDAIFSVGCDRGADPSIRPSQLKAVTTYSGVAKYDIQGRPVDGRSGGGLFSAGGQLIGVCNAAAVEVDEGIYTGLQSVYWQFAKTNLTHLFQPAAAAQLATQSPAPTPPNILTPSDASPASGQTPSVGQLAHPSGRSAGTSNVVARNEELSPPVAAAVYRGGGVPVNNAVYRGNQVPLRHAGQTTGPMSVDGDMEMIVIVRSKSRPQSSETITIADPDAATLSWIRQHGGQESVAEKGTRMAELPDLAPPQNPAFQSQMRSQSPR